MISLTLKKVAIDHFETLIKILIDLDKSGVILRDNATSNIYVASQVSSHPISPSPPCTSFDPVVGGYPRTMHTQMAVPLTQSVLDHPSSFSGS